MFVINTFWGTLGTLGVGTLVYATSHNFVYFLGYLPEFFVHSLGFQPEGNPRDISTRKLVHSLGVPTLTYM